VTIPSCIAAGQYLLRVEHIALHSQPAQIYISCGQIQVTGGGSTTPTKLASFPGAYTSSDPGLKVNIYGGAAPSTYQNPGPAVFTC
jgi:hypothetical protein